MQPLRLPFARPLYSADLDWTRLLALLVFISIFSGAVGVDELTAEQPSGVDYATAVQPLLKARCYACHGALKQEAGLRVDTVQSMREGGDSGAAVTAGDAAASLLWQRIAAHDSSERMPPEHEGELFETEQLATIRTWIDEGAQAPLNETPESSPEEHWAFQPIQRPAVPDVGELNSWVANPIDAFIAAELLEQGLAPNVEAAPLTQVRRLFVDLTGLPPGDDDLRKLARIESDPNWRAALIDQLLDSPQHGERWARHWMDIWRYSDWWGLGDQLRNSQQHIWHWRDWIVESLNEDKPYADMIRMMLAADELQPSDLDELRATGFLARNFYLFNRNQWMDETVEHTGKAFLGLTMNCAKCHDHKYDPISQVDYYQLRAFFEPYHVRLDMVPGEIDFSRDGIPRVYDGLPDAPTYRFIRGDEGRPDKSVLLPPATPTFFDFAAADIQPIALPAEAWQPQRQPWVLNNYIAKARRQLAEAEGQATSLHERMTAFNDSKPNAAAELDSTNSPRSDTADAAPQVAVHSSWSVKDNFRRLDTQRWRPSGGDWQITDAGLEQLRDEQQTAYLDLLDAGACEDFQATLRFTIRGGTPYRSVGIAFDRDRDASGGDHDANSPEALVYVSAHTADPKLQIAYRTSGGAWQYPTDARQSLKVGLATELVLHLRVRGRLINAQVDDGPVLAWTLPVERSLGGLAVSTFTAQVALHHIQAEALAVDVPLVDPALEKQRVDELRLERQLVAAQLEQRLAEYELGFLQALQQLTHSAQPSNDSGINDEASDEGETRNRVLRAQLARDLAQAEYDLAKLHVESVAPNRDAASVDADIAKASEKVELLRQQADAPLDDTIEIKWPRGAQWTPTRFNTSTADDPTVPFQSISTGRRTALANWITDARNPLTARVAVNHLWARHFGQSLLPAEFDLGRDKRPPIHQRLLDWLAVELIESGWSMKHIHRLIANSATYRLASATDNCTQQLAKDPDNEYGWRRIPIRLEAQVIRDSILYQAGDLDLTLGGPSVPRAEQDVSRRRSLYFFHSNNERDPLLTTFDEARVQECYRREQSIVPQQALALSNSRVVLSRIDAIAQQLSAATGESSDTGPDRLDSDRENIGNDRENNDQAFVRRAYRLLLADEPTDEELQVCLASFNRWREAGESDAEVRAGLVWTLLNHHDFITLR